MSTERVSYAPAFAGTVSALVYNQFVLGRERRATFPIAGGQTLKAGSVLGFITSSGQLVLSTTGASDGSQVPSCILGEDIDTTLNGGVAQNFSVYIEGVFNETALVYGSAHTANTVRGALRNVGIILESPIFSSSF